MWVHPKYRPVDALSDGSNAESVGNPYLIQIGRCFLRRRGDGRPIKTKSLSFHCVLIVFLLICKLKMECGHGHLETSEPEERSSNAGQA